jgi:hypothetical protein
MIGAYSQVYFHQLLQAADYQSGSNQKYYRQRDLADYHAAAHPLQPAAERSAAPGKRCIYVLPRGVQRRRCAEDNAGFFCHSDKVAEVKIV